MVTTGIGQLVRTKREERGLTQAELAQQLGMSQRWLSSLETGEILLPRARVLDRIAEVLNTPIADIYVAGQVAKTAVEGRRIAAATPHAPDTQAQRDRLVAIAKKIAPDKLETALRVLTALHESRW